MNRNVVGLIALDEILGFFFGGVVGKTVEFHIRHDFLHNRPANLTCFRIPFDVIIAFEHHLTFLGHYLTEDPSLQAMVRRKALSIMPSIS